MGFSEFIASTKGKIIIAVVVIILLLFIYWKYYYTPAATTASFTNKHFQHRKSRFAGDTAYKFRDQNLVSY
jgi:hypothetical protein